jgi:hypothetical protein
MRAAYLLLALVSYELLALYTPYTSLGLAGCALASAHRLDHCAPNPNGAQHAQLTTVLVGGFGCADELPARAEVRI